MKNRIIVLGLLLISTVWADGLLMPNDENYPANFLRNRVTIIDVDIDELYAQTTVYQEFVNDWTETTDAVWSFPLPYDARSIKLLYTRNDTTFQAILVEGSQSTNPGTGGGGIAALVNDYIGVNGLKLQLRDITPGAIQKIELTYISLIDFHAGECRYRYPLETADFITYPIEHLEVNIHVNSAREIDDYALPNHPYFDVLESGINSLTIRMVESPAYLDRDLLFEFNLINNSFGWDFFSALNTEVAGHFAFFLRPTNTVTLDEVLSRRIVFLLSNASSMIGYKLESSVAAVDLALDELTDSDYFNILTYNYYVNDWRTEPVLATDANKSSARAYLAGISASGGSRLDDGLDAALEQFDDSDYHNSILAFTDGLSPLDPIAINENNPHNVGIFPVAFGDNVNHNRLDMTARLNRGFSTYLDPSSNLVEEIQRVVTTITQPIFQDVNLTFDKPDIDQVIPDTYPAVYAGSFFFISGRYTEPEAINVEFWGDGVTGPQQYGFPVTFTADTSEGWSPAAYLWAAEAIRTLDQVIDIYGETDALKDSSVALSLRYQIRCRYTAYFADYEEIIDPVSTETTPGVIPDSYITGAYPNPFNPQTTLTVSIAEDVMDPDLAIRIYDLKGRLVAIIPLGHLGPGIHRLTWTAFDDLGVQLPAGVYLVILAGQKIHGPPVKLLLLK